MKEISPYDVEQQLKDKPVILDVREPEEWASGHIAGAIHIPLGQLEDRAGELERDKEMIVVCRSGNRSGIACQWLTETGFRAINMTGGMSAWFWDKEYGV